MNTIVSILDEHSLDGDEVLLRLLRLIENTGDLTTSPDTLEVAIAEMERRGWVWEQTGPIEAGWTHHNHPGKSLTLWCVCDIELNR